jgi:predicted CxxxxCH...CXXCH cytochrome family protein
VSAAVRTWFGAACLFGGTSLGVGCAQDRSAPADPPVFDRDVASILAPACGSCHGGDAPAAGWRVATYLDTIGCVAPSGSPATAPPDSRAPILAALDVPPHVGLLTSDPRDVVARWVSADAPAFRPTVHPPGIVDPRSPDWHGSLLRAARWAPMLDADNPSACGRCHEGTPSRPAGTPSAPPEIPSCTSCHDQPGGVLACSTCHGDGTHAYPPRDPCFFPGDSAQPDAHAAHVGPSAARPTGLPCGTCHPMPGPGVIDGLHGNGSVEIVFDPGIVVGAASYDRTARRCAVSCHDRGGARPRPAWSDLGPLGCSDCHGAPPAGHFPGACNRCHAEANADGTALSGGPLHLNGTVDLGDGSGKCGACHGTGDDPWPREGAHPAHENPTLTTPIACESCHVVPSTVVDAVHLGGPARVTFSGLAGARGATPSWNGATCSEVACHGANLVDPPAVTPAWADRSGAAAQCGACHGIPPSQHTASTSCDRSTCHGSEVARTAQGTPLITAQGRTLHVNGVIDVVQ